jgi:predicted permease
MLLELFNVISPVLFIALIGYIWVKIGNDFPTDFVTRLNMNFGAPCLVFVGILNLGGDLSNLSNFMFAAAVALTILLIASVLFVYIFKLPKRAYIIALSTTNCGNMGIPLCLFAFGEAGMAYAIAYFTVGCIFQFTVMLFISHGNLNPGSLLRITLLWGVAAALLILATDTTPPVWLINVTELLAGFTIPIMLITLGASLARLKVIKFGKIVTIGTIKMAAGIVIGFLVAGLFSFEGVEKNVLILQMSMPVAVFSYLLAAKYDRNPEEVASLIFTTTLISFITVPLLLLFAF